MRQRAEIMKDAAAWLNQADLLTLEVLMDIRDLLARGSRRSGGRRKPPAERKGTGGER